MDVSELVSMVWLSARARQEGFSCPDAAWRSCIPTHLRIRTLSALCSYKLPVMPEMSKVQEVIANHLYKSDPTGKLPTHTPHKLYGYVHVNSNTIAYSI